MAVFKCKMCGGSLEITENMTVCECEYCGTQQTLPKSDNEQNLNLFNRASHFRQQFEFDKAAEIYERIIQHSNNNDAELYWSLVLCRYGIEYVDDPLTRKKIPTCHRTQFKSILEDTDYLTALQYADSIQHDLYEREAQYIDTVQKRILEISNKEKPFDVFICYKEIDETGRRTQDSVLAQDLYYGLEREGFKVFFSRITLESKLGTEYEPYIFAALNSAKVMVVIGTKPEYFNAVWVRNEWSRYLMLMQNDKNRTLIPAYRDMNPYDLPDALSMFQAQDMSKLGFMQDLIRGIHKITEHEPEKVIQKTIINHSGSTNVENLLKRGYLCLEDGKWTEADNFFEQVLNEDVEEYRAYIGKLCAELHIVNEKSLVTLQKDFTNLDNYKKACRFGGEAVKQRLFGYYQQGIYEFAITVLNHAQEQTECEKAYHLFMSLGSFRDSAQKTEECKIKVWQIKYDSALYAMQRAYSFQDFQTAKSMFTVLKDYKDSAQKAQECEQKAKVAREREEYDRKKQSYQNAVLMMKHDNIQEIQEAAKIFQNLQGFQDSNMLYQACLEIINEAKQIEERQWQQEIAWQEARKQKKKTIFIVFVCTFIFITIGIVAAGKIEEVIQLQENYAFAMQLYESGYYEKAIDAFETLGDYKNSTDMIEKSKKEIEKIKQKQYENAIQLYEKGAYNEASEIFTEIDNYKDAADYLIKISFYSAQINDVISFGNYEWYVIEKMANTYTLLCKEIICEKKYHDNYREWKEKTTWKNYPSLREWLNDSFYNEFSEEEKALIVETSHSDDETQDYIYLLNDTEADAVDINIRRTGNCWWLRSSSGKGSKIMIITQGGIIAQDGRDSTKKCGVRPVLTIEFDNGGKT